MPCNASIRAAGKVERSLAVAPRRPFFIYGLLYVAVDQSVNARLLFFGESSGKENDSTKCAGLGRSRDVCFIEITLNSDGDEANQQGEKNAQWR